MILVCIIWFLWIKKWPRDIGIAQYLVVFCRSISIIVRYIATFRNCYWWAIRNSKDILKILNKMKNNEFGDIIIQIGSNDCATKKPVQEIIENFDKIIEAAKQVSSTGHVTLGGICPRTDDGDAAARGTEVNSRLQQLAEACGCVHVDHSGTFLLRNGEVNTACLLLDGLHLSEAGSKVLLSNLNLSSKALVRLGRGIRDWPSRPSNSPHHPQQHGTGGAEHRSSLTGHFDHGHSTPRNIWGPSHHAGHQQNNQLRTHHSQPPRRDHTKDPRSNAYRGTWGRTWRIKVVRE